MNTKAAGLAGALVISSLATNMGQAAAATPAQPVSRSSAYAELLKPIANAPEALKAADEAERAQASEVARNSEDVDRHHRRHRHHHHHHNHDERD